jgi:hypothetical protein
MEELWLTILFFAAKAPIDEPSQCVNKLCWLEDSHHVQTHFELPRRILFVGRMALLGVSFTSDKLLGLRRSDGRHWCCEISFCCAPRADCAISDPCELSGGRLLSKLRNRGTDWGIFGAACRSLYKRHSTCHTDSSENKTEPLQCVTCTTPTAACKTAVVLLHPNSRHDYSPVGFCFFAIPLLLLLLLLLLASPCTIGYTGEDSSHHCKASIS